jgi:DNA-binding CsgD family transcriptional regulator
MRREHVCCGEDFVVSFIWYFIEIEIIMKTLQLSRPIRPDDFEIIVHIPEIAAVARDEELRMFWCTPLFIQWARMMTPVAEMMGKTMHDTLPAFVAEERAVIQRRVMETGKVEHHYQLSKDRRMLCSIFPLDEEAFGHRGILALVKDSPHKLQPEYPIDIPVISTPNLMDLDALSTRELEVLHYVACGMTTQEIAEKFCRADKTIEHHINSIHGKLKTHSRAQLVRWASERGIQSFEEDEWSTIVEGARLIRREMSQTTAD